MQSSEVVRQKIWKNPVTGVNKALLHKNGNGQEIKNSVLFSAQSGDVMTTKLNNNNAACHGFLRAAMVRSHYTASLPGQCSIQESKIWSAALAANSHILNSR